MSRLVHARLRIWPEVEALIAASAGHLVPEFIKARTERTLAAMAR